jgi:hypothetical protein
MKKLIFLLFPVFSYGQMTVTGASSGYQTLGIGSINNQTWNIGELIICFAGTTNSGGTPATVSLAGTSQTWTQIDNKLNIAGDYRIQAFRYVATTNAVANATTNITYTGTQDGGWTITLRITGADITGTNGANAIVQSVTDAQNTDANPDITMAAIANVKNSIVCGFINNQNPFGGAPESSWTEYGEGGYSTPTTGGYTMFRVGTTDNTPTVTAASSNWAGIAIELRAAGRRATVIN